MPWVPSRPSLAPSRTSWPAWCRIWSDQWISWATLCSNWSRISRPLSSTSTRTRGRLRRRGKRRPAPQPRVTSRSWWVSWATTSNKLFSPSSKNSWPTPQCKPLFEQRPLPRAHLPHSLKHSNGLKRTQRMWRMSLQLGDEVLIIPLFEKTHQSELDHRLDNHRQLNILAFKNKKEIS